MELSALANELASRCREDYVGLWVLIWKLKRLFPDATEEEVRSRTIELLQELLRYDYVRAGQFQNGQFETWDVSADEIINRVNSDWEQLGHEPIQGDIAWFVALS